MAFEFVARNGVIALNNSTVTGSLNVTAGITGSLLGTASFATTASFALNAGGAAAASNLIFSGSVTASVDVGTTTFRLISGSSTFLFVSSSGDIGVNTTSSTAQLEVRKSAQTKPNIILSGPNNFNGGDFRGLAVTNYYSDVTLTNKQLAIYNADSINYPYLRVSIANLNYVNVEAITGSTAGLKDLYLGQVIYITSGSNVGIGTSTATPTARLQVSGTVNVVNFRGSGSVATSSIFTVDGAAGRLFSVNDSLSGSLFSVNTIAGLPVVEAFSDNTVRIGQFGQRALFVSQSSVGIGIETTSAKLHVSSSTGGLLELDGTGSANVLYVSSSGRISVGRTDPGGRLDIAYAGNLNDPTILLGADDNANTVRTNNSSSLARIGLIHYNKTATASAILIASSTATANTVFIGGGSAYLNSSTAIQFYTAPTTASLTGFQRISIDSTGNVNILSGSFTVTSGSIVDFQVTDTGTKIGNAVTDIHTITGSLNISGSTALTGSFAYSGSISVNSGSIRIASGSIFTPKVVGNTAVPVIVLGTGAGVVPAGGISGSDIAGVLRLTTGTSPAANNPIGTVTFSSAYTTAPFVLITPGNYSASLVMGGVSGTFVTSSTTGFTLFASGPAALRGSTAYTWSYHVIG